MAMITPATEALRTHLALPFPPILGIPTVATSSYTRSLHTDEYIKNHNFLGCEWPSDLDVKQSPNAQDMFRLVSHQLRDCMLE